MKRLGSNTAGPFLFSWSARAAFSYVSKKEIALIMSNISSNLSKVIPAIIDGTKQWMSVVESIQDYRAWVDQSPAEILRRVKQAGGWSAVFPKAFPFWTHKLRNYFNVEPMSLTRLADAERQLYMASIKKYGHLGGFVGKRTLSGDVYRDEAGVVWYQMDAGGTIYHWGKDVKRPSAEAAWTHAIRGQEGTPVFKLVSPDGTGGSRETIIFNHTREASSRIGDVGKPFAVVKKVETAMKYQGSYNFAETAVMGLNEHNRLDVDTHKLDPNYIDPENRFSTLKGRRFAKDVIRRAVGPI